MAECLCAMPHRFELHSQRAFTGHLQNRLAVQPVGQVGHPDLLRLAGPRRPTAEAT